MLNVDQMEIVSKGNAKWEITGLIVTLIDSNTKQYKNYLINGSYNNFPGRCRLGMNQSIIDSIKRNYSLILLETDDSRTWYELELSPQDWLKGKNIFFTKNER